MKKTRTLLDELSTLLIEKDKYSIVESRSSHIIESAINLFEVIESNFDEEEAKMLERKLVNSIRKKDTTKFVSTLRKLSKNRVIKND